MHVEAYGQVWQTDTTAAVRLGSPLSFTWRGADRFRARLHIDRHGSLASRRDRRNSPIQPSTFTGLYLGQPRRDRATMDQWRRASGRCYALSGLVVVANVSFSFDNSVSSVVISAGLVR